MHSKGSQGKRVMRALVGLSMLPIAAWCQTPVVSKVVDAASYAQTLGSPGSIATIFGTNLAAGTATAQSTPLPRQLGGTRVTWNGVAAPLFFVSPTQINFQVPTPDDTLPGVLVVAGVVVTTAAGNSSPYRPYEGLAAGAWNVAGLFTMDGSGCGQGAVLNVAADGGLSVNSAASSASPGDWISVYGTGLDIYSPDGLPSPLPPYEVSIKGRAVLDFDRTAARSPGFVGLAPGLVGVNQLNIQLPETVREGCSVPLQAEYVGISQGISQPVTLAIRRGGGPCVDPPAAGYGQITWQSTISQILPTSPSIVAEPYLTSQTYTVTVSLQAAPGMKAPAVPVYGGGLPSSITLFGPSCPVPGYRSLAAGSVTMQGPGLSSTPVPIAALPQGQLAGLSAYQARVPAGIQAGAYTVAASGGADVGAFQTTVQVGSDIQIQTPLVGSKAFGSCQAVKIDWTGGDPDSWVTVRLVQRVPANFGGYEFVNFSQQARASAGTVSMPGKIGNTCLPAPNEVSIEVEPDPSAIAAFSAPGLQLGGRATWKYVHTFQVK